MVLWLLAALLAAFPAPAAEEPAPALTPAPAAEAKTPTPEDPAALYNMALTAQQEGKENAGELYAEAIKRSEKMPRVRTRSFFNLGSGAHRQARQGIAGAEAALAQQQLDGAEQQLQQSRKLLEEASGLYGQSLMQQEAEEDLSAANNLQKLADDTRKVEELLKKIEELKKRQTR